jgi:4-amino-4-deoxy-L-arabinose transferase-like glycosyltransferase
MGSSDRALMLALPSLAVLAAFALPTLQRSMGAAIDWFSVFFFSGWALTFWVVYLSMQAGVPAKPAMNVSRLLPGFEPTFNVWALLWAALGTAAWIWLVSWRTGRHRHPIWKSLVLPAGGVALNWLLAMTLLLPPLDFAFTYKPLAQRIARHIPKGECIDASQLKTPQVAALEIPGRWRVNAHIGGGKACDWRLVDLPFKRPAPELVGWRLVARERRPGDRGETIVIYRRQQG